MNKKLIHFVKDLSEKIGPRRPTSEAAKRTADYIAKKCKEVTSRVEILSFSSISSFSWPFGLIYL